MTPNGAAPWPLRRLEEVAQVQTGIAKGKSIERDDAISVPYLRVANVQDGFVDLSEVKTIQVVPGALDRYSLRRGDVLFTEGGDFDKLGRGCVWRGEIEPCLHQNHVFAVRTRPDVLLPEFLALLAASPRGKAYFLDCSKQTTNLASINSTQLRAFPVVLPATGEQRKIAAILSSVNDAIEGTQAVIAQLGVLKKATMAELLTRGLPGRHARFKQTEIGEVPEEWEVFPLGAVAELQPGYPFKSGDFVSHGDRLLRGSNVGVGRLEWSSDKTVYFPPRRRDEFRDFVLEAGDIILAMDRPFISEGFKIARLTDADLPALLLQRVGRFRRLGVSASFLWMLLHSNFVQGRLRTLQKGTDLPHISKTEIESCPIPVPTPQEQLVIGTVVDNADDRLAGEQQTVAALRSLKSALMSVLLTGEVRVKPDEEAA